MLVKFIFPSVRSGINNMEVCRVTHSGCLKSLDLDWVAKHLLEVTNLKRDTIFSLYYYDSVETNGFIEVTSKTDFKQLIKYFIDLNQTCRIYAIPHPYADKKPLNSFFSYCHADELPNILEKPSDSINEKIEDPWLKSQCKLCENPNLNAERFTCLFCSNVVLCRLCYLTGYHKEHPLICTRNTGTFSQRLLQYVRIAVAAVPWNYTLPRINNIGNELKGNNSNLSPSCSQTQFFPAIQTSQNTNRGSVITAPSSPTQPIRKRRTILSKTKSQEFK